MYFPFNPIALRKTKIEHNFGLSECSRVKSRPHFGGQPRKVNKMSLMMFPFVKMDKNILLD